METPALRTLAEAYFEKYGDDWKFEPGEGGFGAGEEFALVYRVAPSKVLSFTKNPHGQTRYAR